MGTSLFNNGLKKFKNIHKNKAGILFATGESLKRFKRFEELDDLVKFGVNKIYNHDLHKILDYYFFGSDFYLNHEHREKITSLDSCIQKFSSVYRNGVETGLGNINRKDSDDLGCVPFECCLDIFPNEQSEDKLLGHSIVFPAMQIILYMGIEKIFIVGCDLEGHASELPFWWGKFKEWKDEKYPSVEIISINPVGLKGIFKDYEQI